MLTETFVASTRSLQSQAQATTAKGIGIHLHEYQPILSPKTTFKNSSTQPNSLALSAYHIFAAQADKSVVHVYNKDRGNQEVVVPFQEKITALAFAGHYHGAGTLVLGTQAGRLILWELATGRHISTTQSHLQAVTCLAVDPTCTFILSASSDSNLHLWSLPSLLSFSQPSQNDSTQPLPFSPLKTVTNHLAAINAVLFGHSASKANFAISAANDQTCILWDYINGTPLHTFLLSNNPICLALDPADRCAYAGFEDGSIQTLDFYKKSTLSHPAYDADQQSTPTQLAASDRCHLPPNVPSSPAHCLQVSYDGSDLLSGHENGKLLSWNPATRKYNQQIADLTLPVTNLFVLPPTGFPNPQTPRLKLHNVVKPRYESSLGPSNGMSNTETSTIPLNYTFTAQFLSTLPLPDAPAGIADLDTALTHSSFPASMLEEGIAELAASNNTASDPTDPDESDTLRTQNANLKLQLDDALRRQREAIAEVLKCDGERLRRQEEDSIKKARKKRRRIRRMQMEGRRRKVVMGEAVAEEGENGEEVEKEGLSSDTDEMSSD